MRALTPLSLVLLCCACQKLTPAQEAREEPGIGKASATEVFNLRTKCAELGEKLNSEYDLAQRELDVMRGTPPLRSQDQFSRYDPKTNRCYVELRVMPNIALPMMLSRGNAKALKLRDAMRHSFQERYEDDYMDSHLYDGQTGEELACFQKGIKGIAPAGFIKGHQKAEWYEASIMIDDLMADDQKQ